LSARRPVNYKKHLEEVAGDPNLHHQNVAHTHPIEQIGLFLKATSSVVGASAGVRIRHPDRRTDHEVELAVVIGKPANRVKREDALGFIAGYCNSCSPPYSEPVIFDWPGKPGFSRISTRHSASSA
jgi:2-keto-4-pentenoate hydratase/2-oxohepta-3-ene-1,7-dioic acid hydratase in catechol pathway